MSGKRLSVGLNSRFTSLWQKAVSLPLPDFGSHETYCTNAILRAETLINTLKISIYARGLWNDIETCTILTTSANSLLQTVHDRMPVILKPNDYAQWLDPRVQDARELKGLLQPYQDEPMQAIPVSTRVNSVKFDDAHCLEPLKTD